MALRKFGRHTFSIPATSGAPPFSVWPGQGHKKAPDGLKIVAVASSFDTAERKAAKAGYPMVAVARIPKGRTINE